MSSASVNVVLKWEVSGWRSPYLDTRTARQGRDSRLAGREGFSTKYSHKPHQGGEVARESVRKTVTSPHSAEVHAMAREQPLHIIEYACRLRPPRLHHDSAGDGSSGFASPNSSSPTAMRAIRPTAAGASDVTMIFFHAKAARLAAGRGLSTAPRFASTIRPVTKKFHLFAQQLSVFGGRAA